MSHRLPPFAIIVVCLGLSMAPAHAEETFEQKVDDVLASKPSERFITITEENDLFGSGTDQHYTNGIRATLFNTKTEAPAVAKALDRFVPGFELNQDTAVYYSIGQNMYAPKDLTRVTPNPTDRPYAAFLYGSAGFANITDDHIDNLEVSLGVVGPAALGEQVQKAVHKAIDDREPKGWDSQLKNEPGVVVSWERRWPEAGKLEMGPLLLRASPYGGATLGNVYTYASTGITFQLVPSQYKWQSQPLRIKPSIPGSGYFSVPDGKFAWSLFGGLEGRAMGRNIFLDGNTFTDSPSVDKKYFVGDANAGLALTWGRRQLSYTVNWRSLEFQGQEDADVFGALSFGYRF